MILLSRYIFAGFGVLFVLVSYSFMDPFISYPLGGVIERNKFLHLCIAFFHLGGVAIIAGKQEDLPIRMAIVVNGIIVFALISITLWLLRIWKRHDELIMWNIMFFLMDIGYIMLERLNHKMATKQVAAYVVGVAAALVFPNILARLIKPKYKYLYLSVLIIMMLLPFTFGGRVLGAINWIEIAGVSLQPSEIGKVALVLFLASIFYDLGQSCNKKKTIIFAIGTVAATLGCLVLQRDLGAALLYYLTFLIMLFMATQNYILPFLGMLAGAFGSVMGHMLFRHVRVRVQAFVNPWQDISGTGYQVVQGLFAIGTWGWFGSGLTRGIPHKIPFSANDYIFAAICEEFGNLMGIIILLCYLAVIFQCIKVALKQKNEFFMFVAVGIATLFAIQIFIIIGGVLKLIPLTGITAPFLSAGGSSVVVSIGMIGLITYFSHQHKDELIREGD